MVQANPEELVAVILESIVGTREKFTLTKTEESDLIKLEIKPNKDDIGKIVGKGGSTIWAIRRVAAIAGASLGKKVQVTIVE